MNAIICWDKIKYMLNYAPVQWTVCNIDGIKGFIQRINAWVLQMYFMDRRIMRDKAK